MAETPDHITITVDEVALRHQIQDIIRAEMEEMSRRLRFAADRLDPNFMHAHNAQMEAALRKKWEGETSRPGATR